MNAALIARGAIYAAEARASASIDGPASAEQTGAAPSRRRLNSGFYLDRSNRVSMALRRQ